MDNTTFVQLAVALGLGLLVGFQREWVSGKIAGVRTFTLITVFGAVSAQIAEQKNVLFLPSAALVAVTAVIVATHFTKYVEGKSGPGMTTEVAALLMFGVGVMIVWVGLPQALIVGGAAAVLLHWKKPLHAVADRFSATDIRAFIQLALVALVILPALPNKAYGPYNVLNPFKIWLIVALICGISLCGYMISKFMGPRVGTLLSGVFGGIVSSTATTVSMAREAGKVPDRSGRATVIIMLASTIVFLRVLFEIAIVAPRALKAVAPPMIAMTVWMAAIVAVMYCVQSRPKSAEPPDDVSPTNLRAGLIFGAMYAVVLLAVAATREYYGGQGLYLVSVLSGLTEMNAIALSTAQMLDQGAIAEDLGWRMILIGAMSNLVFKGATVAFLGGRRLTWRITLAFGLSLAGAAALLVFWPGLP